MQANVALSLLILLGLGHLEARADDAEKRFTIDDKAGEVTLAVKKKGALKAFAHDHDMVAKVYTGAIVWVPTKPAGSRVQFEIDTNQIILVDAKMSDDDRADVQKRMQSADVLDVARFPKLTFVSANVEAQAKDNQGRTPLTVIGNLTLHGVTRLCKLEVLLEEKERDLVVTGEHTIKQSFHGIEPYSTAFGTIAVEDDVSIKFRIVAHSEPKGAAK
jgi:polyisoprenoid-binding protein YceI